MFFIIKDNKEKFSSGSVTVYAGNIKSLSRLLRSWTEAWIGQAPTEKFLSHSFGGVLKNINLKLAGHRF